MCPARMVRATSSTSEHLSVIASMMQLGLAHPCIVAGWAQVLGRGCSKVGNGRALGKQSIRVVRGGGSEGLA